MDLMRFMQGTGCKPRLSEPRLLRHLTKRETQAWATKAVTVRPSHVFPHLQVCCGSHAWLPLLVESILEEPTRCGDDSSG